MKSPTILLALLFTICIISVCIYHGVKEHYSVRMAEAKQNCWGATFIPPYVYHRHNSCTGEWSEEVSKSYRQLWDAAQIKIESKNKRILQ